MMFASGYTPGSIANLLAGDQDDEAGKSQSTLFSKVAKNPNKAMQEHRERTKLISSKLKEKKEEINQRQLLKRSIKGANKDKLKILKILTKSNMPSEDKLALNKNHGKEKRNRKEQRERTKKIKKFMSEQKKCTIFVGNLPNTMKKKAVARLFHEHGTVESIRFRSAAPANPKMPKKGIVATKGFHPQIHTLNAYIVFTESSAAEKATALNGMTIEEHHIRVDYLGGDSKHDHKRSIFVGNLPFDTVEEELHEHFKDLGDIDNVRLIKDNFTRLGKGFGYVLFKEKDSVLLALKMDGQKFKGRKIRVQRSTAANEASSKKTKKNNQLKVAHESNPKKRKQPGPDSRDDMPKKKKVKNNDKVSTEVSSKTNQKMKKKDKIVTDFSAGGKIKFRSKEKKKKKLKHRLEKKKKQKMANILSGNKYSDIKKQKAKDKKNNLKHSQGQQKGKGTQRKQKSKM